VFDINRKTAQVTERRVGNMLDKREKTIHYLRRWEKFNINKMDVIAAFVKAKRKQDSFKKYVCLSVISRVCITAYKNFYER
tara:strand:- start:481 stop:723 length:243 start_codon:yes stop_codon:yes gene_type:complete